MKTVLFYYLFIGAYGTQVVFKNSCGYEMSIVQTKDFDDPTLLSVLGSQEKKAHDFEEGNMNFRVGFNGTTRIEFWFNLDGMDLYDVNIMTGFDVPVSITPRKGTMVSCLVSNCKQGVLLPHELSEKTHEMVTGGKFIVTYCPRKRILHPNRTH